MTRRGFLGWFVGTILLIVGCMPRKAEQPSTPTSAPTPQTAPPPPQVPAPPPPAQPPPQQAPVPSTPSASLQNTIALTVDQDENARILREKTGVINDLVNGRHDAIQIATPTEQLGMKFKGNNVSSGNHLVLATTGGKTLNVVPNGTDFIFKDEVGRTLIDQGGILGKAGQPVRLGIAQLREALRNPDKMKGLFSAGTKILIIAFAVWLGAKVGLVILAGLAWLAFLAILMGLFVMAVGPAVRAFKLLLEQAGVNEKDLAGFLKKTGEIAKAVLDESIKDLRTNKIFTQ